MDNPFFSPTEYFAREASPSQPNENTRGILFKLLAELYGSRVASDARGAIEPLAITKEEAFRLVGMPKLVQRWLHHSWLKIVRQGGRGCETIIDYQSIKAAYERFKKGEEPPLLPSQCKAEAS